MIELKQVSKHYMVKDNKGTKLKVDAVHQVSLALCYQKATLWWVKAGAEKVRLPGLSWASKSRRTVKYAWMEKNMALMRQSELRLKRAEVQMVLQNAQSALDPRLSAYDSIAEPIRCLTKMDRSSERQKVLGLAEKVRLSSEQLGRLPHELSGGQQKRVCIARAVSVSPKFIVFDESVSGLDVTVRKEILDLILQLKDDGIGAFLFITHDIDVALYMADQLFVMKDGSIVERIEHAASYDDFHHEYSRQLIQSLPPKSPHYRRNSQTMVSSIKKAF